MKGELEMEFTFNGITVKSASKEVLNESRAERIVENYLHIKGRIAHNQVGYEETKNQTDYLFVSIAKEKLSGFTLSLSCLGIKIIDGDSNGN